MPDDPFKHHPLNVDGPAIRAYAVTPSDSQELPEAARAITIGGSGGVIKFRASRGGQICTTGVLPIGTYAICADQIFDNGTTATGLTAWV